MVVRAGLRAVGVQRCDAATAGRRREVLVPEASRAGPTLAGVLRVHYALCEYPGDDLLEAARAPKTPRRPRSFGVLGRRHADRGRAAPWEYLSRRVHGGSFVACERANMEVEPSVEAPRGPDVVCRSCPREGPIKSSISAIRSSPVHVHYLLGGISLVYVSSRHGGSWVAKTPSTTN